MSNNLVPTLETNRLIIRGHRPDDFKDCVAMWSDQAVTRFIGGKPAAPDEVWSKMLRYAGLWSLLGFGYWAIEEKASGRLVGEAGFADFKRVIEPAIDAPEIGWALAPWAHGRGFATEAISAMVVWGDTHLPSRRTVCMIDPANLPSIRVAQKSGYAEFGRTTFKGEPTILFERK
jgi:RimJ/RimL family protein N-acetyltransferase